MSQSRAEESASPTRDATDLKAGTSPVPDRPRSQCVVCRWVGFAAAGLATGFAAWALIEYATPAVAKQFPAFYQIPPELAARTGELAGGNLELAVKIGRSELVVEYRRAATEFGFAGLVVAGGLGLTAGAFRRSVPAAVLGFLAGILLGAGLGAVGGLAAVWIRETLGTVVSVDPGHRAIVLHAGAWLFAAAGAVSAVYLASRRSVPLRRLAAHAGTAVVLASVCYAVVAAILFPMERSDLVIPGGRGNLMFWTTLFSVAISIAVAGAAVKQRRQPANQPHSHGTKSSSPA